MWILPVLLTVAAPASEASWGRVRMVVPEHEVMIVQVFNPNRIVYIHSDKGRLIIMRGYLNNNTRMSNNNILKIEFTPLRLSGRKYKDHDVYITYEFDDYWCSEMKFLKDIGVIPRMD
jgi:hypothetical protein